MGRQGGRQAFSLAVAVLWLAGLARAQTSSVEYRDFAIFVDGKDSGYSQMSITSQKDGTTVMSAKAAVVVNKLLAKLTYEIEASESWKDGFLVSYKARVNDNGKRRDIQATLEGKQLRVRTGVIDRLIHRDVWVTSFWKLADARFHNKQVPMLDGDTGREFTGFLQFIGEATIDVGEQKWKCYRFRVTGGPTPVDVWFDESHRLVREEFEEQRCRIVIRLTSVRR